MTSGCRAEGHRIAGGTTAGAGFEIGDFVKEKLGGATVQRLDGTDEKRYLYHSMRVVYTSDSLMHTTSCARDDGPGTFGETGRTQRYDEALLFSTWIRRRAFHARSCMTWTAQTRARHPRTTLWMRIAAKSRTSKTHGGGTGLAREVGWACVCSRGVHSRYLLRRDCIIYTKYMS